MQQPKWQKAIIRSARIPKDNGKMLWVSCGPPVVTAAVNLRRQFHEPAPRLLVAGLVGFDDLPVLIDATDVELLPEFSAGEVAPVPLDVWSERSWPGM